MKYILVVLSLAAQATLAQTGTASISGTVVDAKTQEPVPAALVMAVRSGLPPLSRNTKSGADGAFLIEGLAAGTYSLCVQAQGGGYLDPCQWSSNPTMVTVVAGQDAPGFSLRLTAASVLSIQVEDAQKVLGQLTRDGRRPELTLGVWGPDGLYYPARTSRGASVSGPGDLNSKAVYQIAVPRDNTLKLYIASRDLRLGDASGTALPGNAREQTFRHATGDPNPASFTFTVLGLLP